MAKLKYGVYHRAKAGYEVSGDAYFIKEYPDGMLVGLVDGLGSGPLAAEAAQAAVEWISDHHQSSLTKIITGCHDVMRNTRGAVMALVRINTETEELSFVGVGNIGFRAWSAESVQPISLAGIVGSRLPTLREFSFTYTPGDLIVMHTDGISRRFVLDGIVERMSPAPPQRLAEAIADDYAKRNDDVTLVVISSALYADQNVGSTQKLAVSPVDDDIPFGDHILAGGDILAGDSPPVGDNTLFGGNNRASSSLGKSS
jgi:serine/threonine protein phosphatase PrpC